VTTADPKRYGSQRRVMQKRKGGRRLGLVFSLPSPPTARRLFPTAGRTATNGRGLKCEAAGLRALKRAWERASRDERKQLLAQMIHSR